MQSLRSRLRRAESARKGQRATERIALALILSGVPVMSAAAGDEPARSSHENREFDFPTVRPEHHHARMLLENAILYFAPENGMIDPVSGYPREGWNQDPARGLYLRSFTQLTAIGQYMELLANIAAGRCGTPHLSRQEALSNLGHLVKSLREDQRDPKLSESGLLGNFLDLASGKRLGPLAADVEKHKIQAVFGTSKGEAIWRALEKKGWIIPRNQDQEADIQRSSTYGWDHFTGSLTPFSEDDTKRKIMDILDQRVVMIVFIDNANLSAAVAKTSGALGRPEVRSLPGVSALRQELEQFLDDQQAGYFHLYDAKAGQFYFGRDATKNRHFGWVDLQGKWVTGHVDYLVNEFRGPATFVVTRFGLPLKAIGNLGFKMKSYQMQNSRELPVLAPWEGSAFQALGLDVSMTELERPSWRKLLENLVNVEIDYSRRNKLAGFLSESYSGEGIQYTGSIGIPEITVSPLPRITDAASLYTLGTAYTVAPDEIERFLAANWPAISQLLTPHGPWEGYKSSRKEPIKLQTTAHTLALILGLLGTGSTHMKAYLQSRGLGGSLERVFQSGPELDLLGPETQAFAWNAKKSPMSTKRETRSFHVQTAGLDHCGIALVSSAPAGMNLSGGLLSLRYRSSSPAHEALITLKPASRSLVAGGLIPTELFTRLADTQGLENQIEFPLPATPGLASLKEIVITLGPESNGRPLDLTITSFRLTPIDSARLTQER